MLVGTVPLAVGSLPREDVSGEVLSQTAIYLVSGHTFANGHNGVHFSPNSRCGKCVGKVENVANVTTKQEHTPQCAFPSTVHTFGSQKFVRLLV